MPAPFSTYSHLSGPTSPPFRLVGRGREGIVEPEAKGSPACLRSGVDIEQDMLLLELLGIRPLLEVFLQRVSSLDGRDGALVRALIIVRHDGSE